MASEKHRRDIEKVLRNFARDGLKPDEDYEIKVHASANEVFKLLQSKSKYKLDLVIIAGSIGKKTAINTLTTDVDCVVFINNHEPPFARILSEFEDILTLAGQPTNVKCTSHSVQFKWQDVDFDLLPAANFINGRNLSEGQRILEQQKLTLAKINMNPKMSYDYSSSLVESQIQFMKGQDAFTHEFVRFCKYWNKTIIIEDYVSGRSTIIELIAVKSAMEEMQQQSSDQVSMLRAFRTFLEKVRNFDKLNIKFPCSAYADYSAQANNAANLPILQEPANPFNNLTANVKPHVVNLFKAFANETIRRLDQYFTMTTIGYVPLDEVFQVQGNVTKDLPEELRKDPNCMVGTESVSSNHTLSKSMIVRNGKLHNGLIQAMKKYMDIFVLTQTTALTNSNKPNLTTENVKDIAEKGIDRLFGTENQWGPGGGGGKRHEDYDMTFNFPFVVEGQNQVLKMSFKF